ncbi:MAG: transcriptional repressor LexA [Gemmatimonadota bacterium]
MADKSDREPAYDPLTHDERRVYHYLIDFLAENTYQPSVREIGRKLRITSTRAVHELLEGLADKGFVERGNGRSRGVRIVGFSSARRVQPVPLYARINATPPHLTSENRERFVAIDRTFIPAPDVYFLRMVGDELSARGVSDADWILVNPSARAIDGSLVAARVGPHLRVRLVWHLGAVVSLSTGEAGVAEEFLGPSDDFAILGTVAGVWRPFHDHMEDED